MTISSVDGSQSRLSKNAITFLKPGASPAWKVWGFAFAIIWLSGFVSAAYYVATDPTYSQILWAPVDQVIAALGGIDPANYLRLASDLASGGVTDENRWILMLWPPGMPALYSVVLLLPGSAVVPKMLIVSVSVWSAAGAFIATIAWRHVGRIQGTALVLFWILGGPGFAWALGPGLMFSDGIGTALVAVFLGCSYLALNAKQKSSRLINWALAGAAVGASLYFRWAYVGLVVLMIGAGCLVFCVAIVRAITRRQIAREECIRASSSSSIFVASALVVVLPWTLYSGLSLHPGDFQWSNGDYQWSQRWLTDEQLSSAQFLIDGNANWACEIDPVSCSELNPQAQDWTTADLKLLRNRAIEAALTHPVPFIVNRADAFSRGWFAGPGGNMREANGLVRGVFDVAALLYLIFLTFRRRNAQWRFAIVIWGTICSLAGVMAFAHVESRYLIPITTAIWIGGALIPLKRTQYKADWAT